MNYKGNFGRNGEVFAAKYLEDNGYEVLCRNFRCKIGEIDIIAKRDAVISFVEVKTRGGDFFGFPEAAVDRRKQDRMRKIAEYYLAKNRLEVSDVQFDVIAIEIEHIKNCI